MCSQEGHLSPPGLVWWFVYCIARKSSFLLWNGVFNLAQNVVFSDGGAGFLLSHPQAVWVPRHRDGGGRDVGDGKDGELGRSGVSLEQPRGRGARGTTRLRFWGGSLCVRWAAPRSAPRLAVPLSIRLPSWPVGFISHFDRSTFQVVVTNMH